MATRFVQQAQNQLNPVYNQQINALQGQVPAIKNLYDQLTQSLQQQNTQQLNTGVQNIQEDASARGVLRSTLPVDARQALTAQLGAALNTSLGELGVKRASAMNDISQQIGNLNIDRVKSVTGQAATLQDQANQQTQFNQQMALARENAANRGSSGGVTPYQQASLLLRQQAQQAAAAQNYKIRQKPGDAGYKITDVKTGNPISLATYANNTGNDFLGLLASSQSKYDQNAYKYALSLNKQKKSPDKIESALRRKFPLLF